MTALLLWVPLLASGLLPGIAILGNSLPVIDAHTTLTAPSSGIILQHTFSIPIPGERLAWGKASAALLPNSLNRLGATARRCCDAALVHLRPTSLDRSDAVDVSNWRAVPEPASLFMFGTGLLGIAGLLRRKLLRSRRARRNTFIPGVPPRWRSQLSYDSRPPVSHHHRMAAPVGKKPA